MVPQPPVQSPGPVPDTSFPIIPYQLLISLLVFSSQLDPALSSPTHAPTQPSLLGQLVTPYDLPHHRSLKNFSKMLI